MGSWPITLVLNGKLPVNDFWLNLLLLLGEDFGINSKIDQMFIYNSCRSENLQIALFLMGNIYTTCLPPKINIWTVCIAGYFLRESL